MAAELLKPQYRAASVVVIGASAWQRLSFAGAERT
jgi:hypothetical protein